MTRNEDLVDRINDELDQLRDRINEQFGDDDDDRPDGMPAIPTLETSDDDTAFESWYDDSVQPLVEALREYEEELRSRDSSYAKLSAKLEVVTDLLPDRENKQ
ncbi:hypothetical protein [Halosegnis longus]|uniref:Uncharacterized protein n=1 Tax=Halosegnis longus TaxID=2216012 RepID=A0AAJ4R9L3_9EURY|nr:MULTISPECIES: hypothetical protein [Halobacteriales]RNJ26854.1 hypothetical protein Nmn1133_09290 [Salella cibi]